MTYNKNPENIFLYNYIEEMISDYGTYFNSNFKQESLTIKELSILYRIKFENITSQQALVNIFNVSDAYIAKVLRKFENEKYIVRKEDPQNRRKKLIKLTTKGTEKTEELITIINNWEKQITSNITKDEIITLKDILFKITHKEEK